MNCEHKRHAPKPVALYHHISKIVDSNSIQIDLRQNPGVFTVHGVSIYGSGTFAPSGGTVAHYIHLTNVTSDINFYIPVIPHQCSTSHRYNGFPMRFKEQLVKIKVYDKDDNELSVDDTNHLVVSLQLGLPC